MKQIHVVEFTEDELGVLREQYPDIPPRMSLEEVEHYQETQRHKDPFARAHLQRARIMLTLADLRL